MTTDPNIVVTIGDGNIKPGAIPTRSFDFNRGDRRFAGENGFERAIHYATEKARETGVRQVVRIDPQKNQSWFPDGLWLVQDVEAPKDISAQINKTMASIQQLGRHTPLPNSITASDLKNRPLWNDRSRY